MIYFGFTKIAIRPHHRHHYLVYCVVLHGDEQAVEEEVSVDGKIFKVSISS